MIIEILFFPKGVWAKGSSNSGSMLYTSSNIFRHLHVFSPSHLHTFSSSHLLIFSLLLLPSCPLLSPSFLFLYQGAGQCQQGVTKRNPFARNEVRSSKTDVKLRFHPPRQPFCTKWGSIVKNRREIANRSQPFRPKLGSIVKNWNEIAIFKCRSQPFRTKWGSIVKNWNEIATIFKCRSQPFRTKWGSIVNNIQQLR